MGLHVPAPHFVKVQLAVVADTACAALAVWTQHQSGGWLAYEGPAWLYMWQAASIHGCLALAQKHGAEQCLIAHGSSYRSLNAANASSWLFRVRWSNSRGGKMGLLQLRETDHWRGQSRLLTLAVLCPSPGQARAVNRACLPLQAGECPSLRKSLSGRQQLLGSAAYISLLPACQGSASRLLEPVAPSPPLTARVLSCSQGMIGNTRCRQAAGKSCPATAT